MANKSSEKIVDALTQLLEGFNELQESIRNDFGASSADDELEDDEDSEEAEAEAEAAIAAELKTALETVIETEDFAPEEVAALISVLTGSLEEIDPNVFAEDQSADDEDDDYDVDDDDDLEDIDDDELYDDDLDEK